MTHVSSHITIQAPLYAIWQMISDFGAAGEYLVGVVSCTVEGEGVGALRTLTYADDSTILERLATLDEAAHQLSYALLTETPFGDCLTTMTVHELGSYQGKLVWSATFEPIGIPANEAMSLLEGTLAVNCLALKQLLER
ncbi:MAG: SRPBCC family protein [Caldilineaceae bacterium]|nr:SRPBCC family protein [Caldilineaceae bacterium]